MAKSGTKIENKLIDIRRANLDDIPSIVILHKNIFDRSHFTSTFSPAMLENYFRKLIAKNNFNFVAFNDKKVLVGYIISGYQTNEAIKEFVDENRFAVIKALLASPKFIIEKLLYKLIPFRRASVNLRLLFIGSVPKQQIGRQLIAHYENEIMKQGIYQYGLSVRKNNLSAIKFYEKNNFVVDKRTFNSISLVKKLHE